MQQIVEPDAPAMILYETKLLCQPIINGYIFTIHRDFCTSFIINVTVRVTDFHPASSIYSKLNFWKIVCTYCLCIPQWAIALRASYTVIDQIQLNWNCYFQTFSCFCNGFALLVFRRQCYRVYILWLSIYMYDVGLFPLRTEATRKSNSRKYASVHFCPYMSILI